MQQWHLLGLSSGARGVQHQGDILASSPFAHRFRTSTRARRGQQTLAATLFAQPQHRKCPNLSAARSARGARSLGRYQHPAPRKSPR